MRTRLSIPQSSFQLNERRHSGISAATSAASGQPAPPPRVAPGGPISAIMHRKSSTIRPVCCIGGKYWSQPKKHASRTATKLDQSFRPTEGRGLNGAGPKTVHRMISLTSDGSPVTNLAHCAIDTRSFNVRCPGCPKSSLVLRFGVPSYAAAQPQRRIHGPVRLESLTRGAVGSTVAPRVQYTGH